MLSGDVYNTSWNYSIDLQLTAILKIRLTIKDTKKSKKKEWKFKKNRKLKGETFKP
jgi:hypothetical protein